MTYVASTTVKCGRSRVMNYALLVPIRTKENGKKAGEEGEEADGSKASPV